MVIIDAAAGGVTTEYISLIYFLPINAEKQLELIILMIVLIDLGANKPTCTVAHYGTNILKKTRQP